MSYQRFFDGTYVSDNGEEVKVTTLHNPAGFMMTSNRSSASLTITIDDALAMFDRLGLHGRHVRVSLTDFYPKEK